MPSKSKAQYRFLEAVKNGGIKVPSLSPEKASEFTQGQSYKSLPEHVSERAPGPEKHASPLAPQIHSANSYIKMPTHIQTDSMPEDGSQPNQRFSKIKNFVKNNKY